MAVAVPCLLERSPCLWDVTVNKEPSLTLAGVLLYQAMVIASSMPFPSSPSSWEHVLCLWTSWSWLHPTFSAAQPLPWAVPALA